MPLRTPYSRGIVDLASVFIALGWVGLWFLWPSLDRWTARPRDPSVPRVSFAPALSRAGKTYIRPDLFIRSLVPGTPGRDRVAGTLDSLISQPERHPRYLARGDGDVAPTNGVASGADVLLVDVGSYRPVWKDEPVFSGNKATREMRLLSEMSGGLRKQAFEVPSFTDEEMKRFDKPWQVVVHVEVNESGLPAHVILETGCADPRINATVVKAMYRGRIPKAGTACDGRVTLSYGMP